MKNLQQKTVRDYMAAGMVAILTTFGRDQFDHMIRDVIVPGLQETIRSDTGSSRISQLAESYDRFIREHPEEFKHLVVMAMSIGIGFSAMEEVR